MFVLGGTGKVEFGIKRGNIGVLAGSNAITCGYGAITEVFFSMTFGKTGKRIIIENKRRAGFSLLFASMLRVFMAMTALGNSW